LQLLPSIHGRAAVTLHDARGIPTRLVNPITPEDTRDSGSCLLGPGRGKARGGQVVCGCAPLWRLPYTHRNRPSDMGFT